MIRLKAILAGLIWAPAMLCLGGSGLILHNGWMVFGALTGALALHIFYPFDRYVGDLEQESKGSD